MEEGAGQPRQAEGGAQVEQGGGGLAVEVSRHAMVGRPVLAGQPLTHGHKLVLKLREVLLQ